MSLLLAHAYQNLVRLLGVSQGAGKAGEHGNLSYAHTYIHRESVQLMPLCVEYYTRYILCLPQ